MKLIDISAAKYVNIHSNWYKTSLTSAEVSFLFACTWVNHQLTVKELSVYRALWIFALHIKDCGSVTASSPLFEGLLVLLGHVRKSSWTCVHSSKQWFWANWPPRSLLALEVYSLKFMKYSINCPLGFISILALLWNRDFQNMYPCFFLEILLFQFPHTDLWSSILN